MIALAQMASPGREIRYTGVDLFEARTVADRSGVPLKVAHQRLQGTGAHVRLLPGDLFTALARSANVLTPMDLVVLSAGQDPESLARAWFYLPRLLRVESVVLAERLLPDGGTATELLEPSQIAQLAATATTRRRAA